MFPDASAEGPLILAGGNYHTGRKAGEVVAQSHDRGAGEPTRRLQSPLLGCFRTEGKHRQTWG